jgi:hypothetical protein
VSVKSSKPFVAVTLGALKSRPMQHRRREAHKRAVQRAQRSRSSLGSKVTTVTEFTCFHHGGKEIVGSSVGRLKT